MGVVFSQDTGKIQASCYCKYNKVAQLPLYSDHCVRVMTGLKEANPLVIL